MLDSKNIPFIQVMVFKVEAM